jgi:tRNA wybutosine-synthesizing protein 1
VTNGTNPKVIENLDPLPTQLYISVVAPNEEIYKKLCRPLIKDGWQRLNETLEILPSLRTRTVIRHTLVNGWNMDADYIAQYAKLDEKAEPWFIEPKGYMFVGSSRQRMNIKNMPSHEKVKKFGEKIASLLDYGLVAERKDSRVVLLSRKKKIIKIKNYR